MSDIVLFIIVALAGYFIGNIEFAVIISRLTYKDDIRKHGSGNAGTTNMMRVYGMKPGLATFLGDFLKGLLGTLLLSFIGSIFASDTVYFGAKASDICKYTGAMCIVIGHDYPILFGLRGGKGAASSLGIAFVLAPIIALVVTVLCFILIYATQIVSLGSLLGMTIFSASLIIHGINIGDYAMVTLAVLLCVILVIRHSDNISRLLQGKENKLFKRPDKHENNIE